MIIRNGIKSALRSRGRAALFMLLIFALTLTFTLGVGMWANCAEMQAACDETYTSIATLEYMGSDYPNSDTADSFTREIAAELDHDALMAVDGVQLWEPEDRSLAYVEGYTRRSNALPYGDMASLVAFNFIPYYEMQYPLVYVSEEEAMHPDAVRAVWDEENYEEVYSGNIEDIDSATIYYWDPWEEGWYTFKEVNTLVGYYCVANRVFYSSKPLDSKMLTVIVGDSGFVAESGKRYALHGRYVDGNRSGLFLRLEDFYEGGDTPPYMYVTDKNDPALDGSMFEKSARSYHMFNNHVNLIASDDIASLEPFNQGTLYLESGRMPEAGEAGVCVLSGGIARSMELELGDTIEITRLTSESDGRFGLGGTWAPEPETLSVVGITNSVDDYLGDAWVSAAEGGRGGELFGYSLGRLRLDNAKGRAAADAIQEMMPANVRVTLLDQGYSSAAQPIATLKGTAQAVTLASACGALAVLVLFAYLFVGRQQATVMALNSMGTPGGKIRLWLLSGASVISAAAAALGALAGWLSLDKITKLALSTAQELYSSDQRYSEAAVGLRHELAVRDSAQILPAIGAGVAVFLTALVLCVVFTQLAQRENRPKKGKMSVRVPKGGTSTALSGSLRFALTSARRGGMRSGIVPAATLVLSLLLGTLGMVSNGWSTQLDSLYADSVIEGQVVSVDGRSYSDISMQAKKMNLLTSGNLLSGVYVSYGYRYAMPEEVPKFGNSSFAAESRKAWYDKQAQLIGLNDLSAAPEFYYSGKPEVTYLDGWDESFLTEYDREAIFDPIFSATGAGVEPYPVLTSNKFLEENGRKLGDTFDVSIHFDLGSRGKIYTPVEVKVVGSFEQVSSKMNLYMPLKTIYDPEWFNYPEEDFPNIDTVFVNLTIPQDCINLRMSSTSFSTVRFSLANAAQLGELKDYLSEQKFSSIGKTTRNRITILLRDQSFTEAVGNLNRHITLGRILLPILLIVVCVMGFIISWLMINGRRMEFAIIRGFGASWWRMFMSFFLEQALLCLAGCLVGALVLALIGGAAALPAVAVFFVCYLLGCALSVISVGRTHLMNLLSEGDFR